MKKSTQDWSMAIRYVTARKRYQEQLGFLAHVGRILSQNGNIHDLLKAISSAVIPYMADLMLVETQSRQGSISTLETGPKAAGTRIRDAIASSHPPNWSHELREPSLIILRGDERSSVNSRRLLDGIEFDSGMYLQLVSRGQTWGALFLARRDPVNGRSHDAADLALGRELALRLCDAFEREDLYLRLTEKEQP